MRVLILGGSGFLGARVWAQLREGGHDVSAPGRAVLDLTAPGRPPDLGPCDAALFLAQSRRHRDWPEGAADLVAVNVLGATRALELARRAGVRRFLLASSGSVYGPADAPLREDAPLRGAGFYARTKRMAEEVLAAYSTFFETLCVRPFVLYGPGQRERMVPNIVGAVARGEAVRLEPRRRGEARPEGLVTSPCFVDDAAKLVVSLLHAPATGSLNLAGPEAVSVRRIAECAGELLGREPRFRVEETPRAGDLVADLTELRKHVSRPFTPFAEGLRRLVRAEFDGARADA